MKYDLKNLRALRRKRGCTQETLAKTLNVSRSTISMWESGSNEPDIRQIISMAHYFSVSTDYLLGHGNPSINILSDREVSLVHIFRKMEKSEQEYTLRMLEFISGK